MNEPKCVLHIVWMVPGMPSYVGPFDTREEAEHWAVLNIPNGSWSVVPLARPYAEEPCS